MEDENIQFEEGLELNTSWTIVRGRTIVTDALEQHLNLREKDIVPEKDKYLLEKWQPIQEIDGRTFVTVRYGCTPLIVVEPVSVPTMDKACEFIRHAIKDINSGVYDSEITHCHAELSKNAIEKLKSERKTLRKLQTKMSKDRGSNLNEFLVGSNEVAEAH